MEEDSYFTDDEIQCKCSCGFSKFQPRFYFKMNTMRDYVGHPIRVNSWCRCDIHNFSVGGSSTSSHLKGLAADLNTPTEYIKYRILFFAGMLSFRGVGVGKNFIHLDDDRSKSDNRFWIY